MHEFVLVIVCFVEYKGEIEELCMKMEEKRGIMRS